MELNHDVYVFLMYDCAFAGANISIRHTISEYKLGRYEPSAFDFPSGDAVDSVARYMGLPAMDTRPSRGTALGD